MTNYNTTLNHGYLNRNLNKLGDIPRRIQARHIGTSDIIVPAAAIH